MSSDYLGCNIDTLRAHIEAQFIEVMSLDNYGEWHIDHKIPIKYRENGEAPPLEALGQRVGGGGTWHSRVLSLCGQQKILKGNRYITV